MISPNDDIELTVINTELSDETISAIMDDINTSRCEKCGAELSGDFHEQRVCEECCFMYCLHCVNIIFSETSCICKDCARWTTRTEELVKSAKKNDYNG